jgi:LemA protein
MELVAFLAMAALAMCVVPLALLWSSYNRLMALDSRCETANADIDVHLKHRHNLIPGLVETVRGFAKHEANLLTEVTKARASALSAGTMDVKMEAETQLGQSVATVLQVAERYPELAASAHFHALRQELVDAENRITASRRFSNLAIEEYNSALRQFPGSLVGQYRRLSTRRPFDLGIERVLFDEPVAIKF